MRSIPILGPLIFAILMGATATILVAWAAALWSPAGSAGLLMRAIFPEDGKVCSFWQMSAFGWRYSFVSGSYVAFYEAGWPFYAMFSRIDERNSFKVGPKGMIVLRRWQLPFGEIIHRGVGDQDFPAWWHVQPNRRVSLIPRTIGFAADTIFYAIICWLMARLFRVVWPKRRGPSRGFPVIMKDAV